MPPTRASSAARRTAPPRRRDAADTRARLMAAGRRAFAQKGLAGAILTDDILAPAGVSTGSFYHQFRDKNELLLAILDEHARRFREQLAQTLSAPGEARGTRFADLARDCFALALDLADDHGDLLRIERRERDSDDRKVARYLRQNHERWVSQVADYFAQGSDDLARGSDGLARGSDGLARGSDDLARGSDDLAHASDGELSEAERRLAAQFVIDLGLTAVARYQDLPARRRPAERERLLDALVRFTIGGLPGLTRERNPNQESRS